MTTTHATSEAITDACRVLTGLWPLLLTTISSGTTSGGTPSSDTVTALDRRVDLSRDITHTLARIGITRRDIHPAEALIELVQYTAGEVDYWRHTVSLLDDQDLVWGTTRIKEGGDDRGTTQEAKPHIAYVMLERASDRLATYAAAALKAGVEERRVRLAEAQGSAVAAAIRSILDQLKLTPPQLELVPTIVPAALRALASQEAS
jgi:hypothetical protein